MKTIKLSVLSFALLLFTATSCFHDVHVRGNGILASEGRIVTSFNKVASSGSFIVHITEGDEYEVIVSAEENIIPYIETFVSGNVLNIEIRSFTSIRNSLPIEVFITTPDLEGILLSGSGVVTTDYFVTNEMDILLSGSGVIKSALEAADVSVSISGSGTVDLSGFADNAHFKISGSGNIVASDLDLFDCRANISSSGDMWVTVENSLDVTISGSGNIYYYGNPQVEFHISGTGNIIPLD
ncbi:MAG: head GIN domain-containing protein [Bacteroidota bacterium]